MERHSIPIFNGSNASKQTSLSEKGWSTAWQAKQSEGEAEVKFSRQAWLDYLRAFAILAVITGHVVVDFYRYGKVGPAEWWLAVVLGVLARSAVPVFVMVSGALLLGKTYTLEGFYKKRAMRLIPPILFWNFVYLGVYILDGMDTQTVLWTLKALFIVNGYIAPHLWYLSMFICLMMFAPFLNKFILGEKPTAGELALLLGLTLPFFVLQQIANVADTVYHLNMEWFTLFPWFMVYFLAGYTIDKHAAAIRLGNGWIVVIIALLVAVSAALNYYAVSSLGILRDDFINTDRGLLQFLLSILIFLLAKNLSPRLTANKIILKVAEASFGMYLIHEIFNGFFVKVLPDYYSRGLLYIPLVTVLTTILSFASVYLFQRIRAPRLIR